MRGVGDDDLPALLALAPVGEVGAEEHQAGQLALAAGGGLQRHGVQAGDLAQDLLQLPLELERALGCIFVGESDAGCAKPGSATSRSLMRGLYFIVQLPSG